MAESNYLQQEVGMEVILKWVDLFGTIIAATGLILVYLQLRDSSNTATASLLITINRDLNSYSDAAILLEESEKNKSFSLSSEQTERFLDYISYFEGLYLSFNRGLFEIEELDTYFSGRFFRLANNSWAQQQFLLNTDQYGDIFRPIFKLHEILTEHRKKHSLQSLFPDYDLLTADNVIYKEMST